MISPHSVIEFGLMRHEELQAEVRQMRRTRAATLSQTPDPGVLSNFRAWAGSALVRLGMALHPDAGPSAWESLGSGS